MRLTVYHGTTAENLLWLLAHGLRKGSWVSPDESVARHFADSRSKWNGREPIVVRVRAKCDEPRNDRSGRAECQTKEVAELVGDGEE